MPSPIPLNLTIFQKICFRCSFSSSTLVSSVSRFTHHCAQCRYWSSSLWWRSATHRRREGCGCQTIAQRSASNWWVGHSFEFIKYLTWGNNLSHVMYRQSSVKNTYWTRQVNTSTHFYKTSLTTVTTLSSIYLG